MVRVVTLPERREQRARLDRLDAEPDILTALCERLASGVSEVDVAHDYGVSLRRLGKWLEDADHPERQREYQFALRCYAKKLGTETIQIADEQGEVVRKDGSFMDPDVGRDTLRVNTRLKVAGKLDRALWGEKVDVSAHLSIGLDVLLGRVEDMAEGRTLDVTPTRDEQGSAVAIPQAVSAGEPPQAAIREAPPLAPSSSEGAAAYRDEELL